VDGAAREERPPAVWAPPPGNARAKGGKWGGQKTGGRFFFFETKQSEPNRSLCACFGLRGLQRRSCEKQVVRKGVTRKHPSRDGSGILSVEDGTQALEKLRLNYVFGLAGEHCFGFGKFNKDGSSRRPPRTPTGFNHQGSKSEALVRAEAFGRQVVALEVFVLRDCRTRVLDGRRDIAKATGNGEVERKGGAAAPSWKIDVRGTPSVRRTWTNPVLRERTLEGAWLEEPWLFEFWVETSGGGEVEHRISKKIVPFSAVPPAWAEEAMVAELIKDAIAKGADPI
jgi:hypothetical protein